MHAKHTLRNTTGWVRGYARRIVRGMTHLFTACDVSCATPPREDGDEQREIFAGLEFSIDAGEIVDLIGPSGEGKSSLLTACALLNPHAHGTFTLEGRDSSEFTPQQWRRLVAYVPQHPILTGASVAEALRLPFSLAVRRGIAVPDDAELRAMMDTLGCGDVELSRAPHDLSGGQAARVCLARTLLTKPKLLLADEVDAGLDDDNAALVAAVMAHAAHDDGMAIVRIRHRPPDGMAKRIMRLEHGELAQVDATEDAR